MREQKGIFVPDEDTAKFWGKNFEVREYNKIAPKGKLALDIGAHVCIWTSRLANDFEEVIAFEPLKKHIDCHKKNCEGLENVTLHEIALSDKKHTAVMTTKDINSGMSTLSETKWKSDSYPQMVETRTLDSYKFPKIDFIKIDVEGWEEYVLEGAMQTILKDRPRMYIEIWKKNFTYITSMLAQKMGYDYHQVSKLNYICEPMEHRRNQNT